MLQETCKADALRSNVIEHCLQQYDSLSDLMTGDGLNADMPSHIRYTCLHDRLNAMADPTSMVGELEISQTAEVLNKTIKIVNKDSDNVLTYGEEFADPMPISLLYTPLGNCAGHYDTLRKSNPSEQLNRIPCSPVLGLSLPTLPPKKNSKRKRRAEILTSSPYKKSLEEAAAKKVKKTKAKATRTQAKRKPKSKQTHANDRIEINVEACSDTDSWYCFMCEESYKEKMICCRGCAKWVHVDCAGTDDDLFVCEICSDNIS